MTNAFPATPPELQGLPPRDLVLIEPLLEKSKRRMRNAVLYTGILVAVVWVVGRVLPAFTGWHVKGLTKESTPWMMVGVTAFSLLFLVGMWVSLKRAKNLFSKGNLVIGEVKSVTLTKRSSEMNSGYLKVEFAFEREQGQKVQGQVLTVAERTSLQTGAQVPVLFLAGKSRYCALYDPDLGLVVGTWRSS